MASVNTTHTFLGTPSEVFKGITDYAAYADYIPGVLKTEILEPLDKDADLSIRYEINIVKKFHYTLNMFHKGKSEILWTLEGSNIMKENEGHWRLKKSDKKGFVDAEYAVNLKFRGLVPSAIINKITQTSLPAMFEGFQSLIDSKKK